MLHLFKSWPVFTHARDFLGGLLQCFDHQVLSRRMILLQFFYAFYPLHFLQLAPAINCRWRFVSRQACGIQRRCYQPSRLHTGRPTMWAWLVGLAPFGLLSRTVSQACLLVDSTRRGRLGGVCYCFILSKADLFHSKRTQLSLLAPYRLDFCQFDRT